VVICTARIASAGLNGRIETTIGPANGPAGEQAILVRYIGTRSLRSTWRIGRPSAHQRFLERIGAAEHEGDEVVAPMRRDVGRLVGNLAIAPDPVARQVGADVEIDPKRRNPGIADIGHADDRARLWIKLAKTVKGGGELFGEDREIALHITVGLHRPWCGHAGATIEPRLQARKDFSRPALFSIARCSSKALRASTGGAGQFYHANPPLRTRVFRKAE